MSPSLTIPSASDLRRSAAALSCREIERYTHDPTGAPLLSAVAALGITNLAAQPGSPKCLATLVRHHWGIESLHWRRDSADREETPPPTPDQSPA